MQDLRLIGVHEDGLHLLLAGPGGEHFTVPIDDALRQATRRDRPRMGQLSIDIDGGMRPREVQSLIRAGGSTEEVADRAGWSIDKVRRYEGPILAERAHVADQARLVRVRHRGGSAGGAAPTLQGRVAQRMRERGVDPETSSWDAWRLPDATSWTIALTFAAGGRQRQASWLYDPVLRSVEAVDDEARWLSADEAPGAGPLPSSPGRAARVYDVEAEGGVAATTTRRASRERPTDQVGSADEAPGTSGEQEPVDLMTAMRQRTTVGRRSGRRRAEPRGPVAPALPLDHPVDPNNPDDPGADAATGMPSQPPATMTHHEPALPGELAELEPTELEPAELEPAGAEVPPLDDRPEAEEEPATVEAPPEAEPGDGPGDPAEAEVVPEGSTDEDTEADTEADTQDDTGDGATEGGDAPSAEPSRPPSAKRKPRTSVPSWDDIMFGTKRD